MSTPALHIAKPCHENWEVMTQEQRGRHCSVCKKTVVDIAAMPTGEAVRFMHDLGKKLRQPNAPSVCVRAPSNGRGGLLRPSAKRYLLTNGLAAILAMSISGCSAHSGSNPQSNQGHQQVQQGTTMPTQIDPQPMMGSPAPIEMGDAIAPAPVENIKGEVAVPEPRVIELGKVAAPAEDVVIEPRENT